MVKIKDIYKSEMICKKNNILTYQKKIIVLIGFIFVASIVLMFLQIKHVVSEAFDIILLTSIFDEVLSALLVGICIVGYEYYCMLGTADNRRAYYDKVRNIFDNWDDYQIKRELSIYSVDESFLPILSKIIKWYIKLISFVIITIYTANAFRNNGELSQVKCLVDSVSSLCPSFWCIVVEIAAIIICVFVMNCAVIKIRIQVMKDISESRM